MTSVSEQLQEMRDKISRADALLAEIDRLKEAKEVHDLSVMDAIRVLAIGRKALIQEAEAELLRLFPSQIATVGHEAWEALCDIPRAVGIFVGEGDDCGCQCPWVICMDEETAKQFIDWQKSLSHDEQRGDLHAMPLRCVEGELWNSVYEARYDLPRVPKD